MSDGKLSPQGSEPDMTILLQDLITGLSDRMSNMEADLQRMLDKIHGADDNEPPGKYTVPRGILNNSDQGEHRRRLNKIMTPLMTVSINQLNAKPLVRLISELHDFINTELERYPDDCLVEELSWTVARKGCLVEISAHTYVGVPCRELSDEPQA